MIRDEIYKRALYYLGTTEMPKNSNNVIFNTDYYGHSVSGKAYPWCCVFTWDIYRMAGASKYWYNGGKTASCTTLLNWYKKNKPKSVHKDLSRMKRGDLVFYQFDKDANADHIGIFEKALNGTSFYAIEGNTSPSDKGSQDEGDGVYRKTRKMDKVMAFVSMEFDDEKAQTNPYKEPTTTVKYKPLMAGTVKEDVKWVQWELNFAGADIKVDGKFGQTTLKTVKEYQATHKYNGEKLVVDGSVGAKTRGSMKENHK